MQHYSVSGWVPLNFEHEFIILNSEMDIDGYTKVITHDKQITIKFRDQYSQMYTSDNGFTKIKLIHLMYGMLKEMDDNKGTLVDLVLDGFTYDPVASIVDIQTSS